MKYAKFLLFAFITYLIGQQFTKTGTAIGNALIELPGTFLHECMHFIMAWITDGSPSDFTIIPDGNTLGSVMFSKNWYNAAVVGLAPFLLAPITVWFIAIATNHLNPFKITLWLYLAACAWASCVPSGQDFSIAMSMPSSWPFAGVLLGFTSWVMWVIAHRTIRSV